jgi:very-short-patch-repair endonuclease
MRVEGIPTPVAEYQGIPGRRFRFDFAWPGQKVALECEGGVWMSGKTGHTLGKHYEKDCLKYSLAASHGWLVIRATNHQIESGEFIGWVRRALELRS